MNRRGSLVCWLVGTVAFSLACGSGVVGHEASPLTAEVLARIPLGYDQDYALHASTDLDGDGAAELLLGLPRSSSSGRLSGLVLGFDGAGSLPIGLDDAVFLQPGDTPLDLFGARLADGGDIDGDGLSDVLVSAPGSEAGGVRAGEVQAWRGAELGTDGAAWATFRGDDFDLLIDMAWITGLDGTDDPLLVVGAPFATDRVTGELQGRWYVFAGPVAAGAYEVADATWAVDLGALQRDGVTWAGEVAAARFELVADQDGDGALELHVPGGLLSASAVLEGDPAGAVVTCEESPAGLSWSHFEASSVVINLDSLSGSALVTGAAAPAFACETAIGGFRVLHGPFAAGWSNYPTTSLSTDEEYVYIDTTPDLAGDSATDVLLFDAEPRVVSQLPAWAEAEGEVRSYTWHAILGEDGAPIDAWSAWPAGTAREAILLTGTEDETLTVYRVGRE